MMNLVALDCGAESGRLILGTFDGTRIELEELHRFATGFDKVGEYRRWNVSRLLDEIGVGVRAAESKGSIASLGIDTWGVDGGFLDGNGELCEWPFAYRDFTEQNMNACQALFAGGHRLYEITGIQHLPFNTAYQLFALRQRAAPVLDKAERFLFMPDLLQFLLCGHAVAEETIASTSQLLDVRSRTWSTEILDAIDVRPSLFLPLTAPGTRSGRTVAGTDIEVVTVAGHDTGSAVAAVPAEPGTNWAFLSSGTWSVLGIESEQAIVNAQTAALQISNEWGVCNTVRVLKNIMGLWILQGARKSYADQGQTYTYPDLVEQAEQADPFMYLIDVDDMRFFAPADMLAEINGFCEATGQGVPGSVGAVVRCVLESLALRYAETMEKFNDVIPAPIERLHVIGGGAQNKLLCRMTAEAAGIPVMAGPVEATALGNLLVQLMATGEIDTLDEGRRIISASFGIERYEPGNTDAWAVARDRLRVLVADA